MKGDFGDWPMASASLGGAILALAGTFIGKLLSRLWHKEDLSAEIDEKREARVWTGMEREADRLARECEALRAEIRLLVEQKLQLEREAWGMQMENRILKEKLGMRDGTANIE